MIKRIKYQETIIRTHYLDVECENEDTLNNFIHDNQKFYIETTKNGKTNNNTKTSIKGKAINKYPDVVIKKLQYNANGKSLGCTYVDEIDLNITR